MSEEVGVVWVGYRVLEHPSEVECWGRVGV